jgi:DNA-binding NarL/FixJ family response regulator
LIERRVVLVTIPPLLSEVLVEVASKGIQLRVIAQIERELLAEQLPLLQPDIVLIGLRIGETDEIGSAVLQLVPGARVLVLSNDVHDAYLHEMRPHRTVLRNFSPANLLAALEGSASARQR